MADAGQDESRTAPVGPLALPLAGVRVVDAADRRAALASRLLADLGADVIRIEADADGTSSTAPPYGWLVRNGNKRVLRLTAGRHGEELSTIDRLIGGADILFVSPGSALPATAQDYLDRHPSVVIVSVSDFGMSGPYAEYQATSAVMAGLGWMLFKAGDRSRPPVLPPAAIADDIAAIMGAFAAITALRDSRARGAGQIVDFAAIEALQQTTDWGLANTEHMRASGVELSQLRTGGGEAQPIVTCKDGWVRLAILATAEWRRIRSWLGEPSELQDAELDLLASRVQRWAEIEPHFLRHFAGLTMIEASEEGQRRRIPVTPVLRPADVLDAPQFRELGTFAPGPDVDGVAGMVPTGFWSLDQHRAGYRRPPLVLDASAPVGWLGDERVGKPQAGQRADGPYAGLRVLDLGVAGAAPELARLLGEYGADVVRVESPRHPDLLRQLGGASGVGPTFISTNRCKRSFGLNLADPRGVEIFRRLVGTADVLVENAAPGAFERWGLSLAQLRRDNPRLITFGSQMMGQRGPWREWRGYGANTQPPGGLVYLWSYPDLADPIGTNLAFPDHVVGRLGALAVAACLSSAQPAGLHVDLVQAEVAINLMGELYLQESVDAGSVGPAGNTSPEGSPWGVYQCRGEERWCVITCRDDADWANLVRAVGEPDWATDDLAAVAGRRSRAAEIDAKLAQWTSQRTDAEVMTRLQDHGVPAGYVMYPGDITTDPHLSARRYPVRFDQPRFGPVVLEGGAFRSQALPAPRLSAAPLLGEHTIEIASELGLSAADIDALISDGVLHIADTSEPSQVQAGGRM